jgi:hypothetical protein
MRHLAITFHAVTAFAVGCKPAAEKSVDENRRATADQLDKVKKETKEATHQRREYAFVDERQDRPLSKDQRRHGCVQG